MGKNSYLYYSIVKRYFCNTICAAIKVLDQSEKLYDFLCAK